MKAESLDDIYRAKQERRAELAELPAEEKLRIMKKLQEMGHSMIAARDERPRVVSDESFQNEEVVLDSKQFVNCKFDHCAIVINGLAPFGLVGCNFKNCAFVFGGPAQLTLQALTMMYHNGFKPLTEQIFTNIREGLPPKIDWPQNRLPEN